MSVLPTTLNGMVSLEDAIVKAVRERIDELVANEVEAAQRRVAQRVPEVVTGVALSVMKMMNMQRFGDELRICVKLDGVKP